MRTHTELEQISRESARKDRALAVLRAASPVFAAALLGGWTTGTVLAGAPSVLLAMSRRPYLGLVITTLLEMAVISRFGIVSFLTLLAVWLVWLPGLRYHAAGGVALAVAGVCAPVRCVQVVLWSIALVTTVAVAGAVLRRRFTAKTQSFLILSLRPSRLCGSDRSSTIPDPGGEVEVGDA